MDAEKEVVIKEEDYKPFLKKLKKKHCFELHNIYPINNPRL